jgi:predicted AAA+ superfamily ATPase
LAEAVALAPVVVVTGARQTGKSTLVRAPAVLGGRLYVTLDDAGALEQARKAPDDLVRRAAALVIDEVQRAPSLLLAVKRAADEERSPGRFVLTGSANLLAMQTVADSLAGRATYLTLGPLTRREQLGFGDAGGWTHFMKADLRDWPALLRESVAPPEPWRDLAQRGGYPVPAYHLQAPRARAQWFDGYVRTFLERDVVDLAAVQHAADLRRLMRAAALRVGGLLNQADLARDIGLPPSTAQRYLHLLEASHHLVLVPAFAVNRTKRLTKAPKVYWSDPGLALHLSGEHEVRGAHLENIVAADLMAWREAQVHRPEVLHWRTSKGAEVDFVIEQPDALLAIEVKAAAQVGPRDAQHLTTFLEEYPEARGGLVLYDGEDVFWLRERVLAVPWWKVM